MATAVRPMSADVGAASQSVDSPGENLIAIQPFILELPVKGALPKGKKGGKKGDQPPAGAVALPAKLDKFQEKPAVHSYVGLLCKARETALSMLESTSATAAEVNNAVADYMSLLLGLTPSVAAVVAVPEPGSQAAEAGPAVAATEEETVSQLHQGQSSQPPASSQKTVPRAPSAAQTALNNAIEFRWADLFPQPEPSSSAEPPAGGALFESAMLLLSHALWKAHAAALIANSRQQPGSPERGLSSERTAEAYRLLREAAGLASALQADPFLAAATRSGAGDLRPSLLAALEALWLADAESLTVGRALSKGTSHPLVAAVAADCCELYRKAEKCPPAAAWGSTIVAYARFKAGSMSAYAHISNAQHLLDQELAADAMRSAREAKDLLATAATNVEAFDRQLPKLQRDGISHGPFLTHLRQTVERAADRIQRINSMVHYKAEAPQLPPLPEPSRLVQPLPLELPPVSPEAIAMEEAFKEGVATSAADEKQQQAAAAGGGAAAAGEQEEDEKLQKEKGGCCCVIS
mmetsp:Transcript_30545/g.86338  ORF Transcript_30545/g.86338 Transcript_30545/m.86338 type:complete len:523 (+) Transcript_30545:139-1707(+)